MTLLVITFLIFVAGVLSNAFFAGYETGFVAASPVRVRHLAEKENDFRAKRLLRYMENPERMITVVLLGTNLSMVIATTILTQQIGELYTTLIATPLILIFGEVVPKSMFRAHPTRASLALLPAIHFFDTLLSPIVVPVTWLSQSLLNLFGAEKRDIRLLLASPEDVRSLVDESAQQGTIEPEEKEMIHSIMDLQKHQANEIMIPRIDILALPDNATRPELIKLVNNSGRSRIPIYKDTIDTIVGVVNVFDLLTDDTPEEPDIRRFIQNIMHVPDTMRLDDVLDAMRAAKQPMAIVIDEYGGTDGLIAIEDILEEIFGEIHDEYDKQETRIRKIGNEAYVIDARAELEEVSSVIGLEIVDDEVETIGGWLMHAAGRIPVKGEKIEHGRFRATVLGGSPNSVSSIRLEILPPPPEAEKVVDPNLLH